MAIQKSVTDITGTVHATAYTIIKNVWLEKVIEPTLEEVVWIDINIYHDATARSKSDLAQVKQPLMLLYDGVRSNNVRLKPSSDDVTTYFLDSVLDDTGKSPMKQAYAWLKTQSSQAGVDWTTGTTDV